MATPPVPAVAAAVGWRGWLSELTLLRIAVASSLGIAVALILHPIFATPLLVLIGRTLFLSMVLLCVFIAAGRWKQSWWPRWLVQVLAVGLAAPLGTLIIYMVSTGGDWRFFSTSVPHLTGFSSTTAAALIVGIVVALGALVRERDAQARAQRLAFELERETLERRAADARLSLLQAQIEPHFLFNTLANVQALVETGSPRAPEVLKSLIAYLRAAVPRLHGDGPTLGDELTLVRSYLELMQMRMPDRLAFTVDAAASISDRAFPAMALLTLVENAVHHGIDPSEQGGRIEVGAREDGDVGLRLWVEDTGVGMADSASPGTGLSNLRERLQVFFGPNATLQWSAAAPHGLRAEIVIPAPSRT